MTDKDEEKYGHAVVVTGFSYTPCCENQQIVEKTKRVKGTVFYEVLRSWCKNCGKKAESKIHYEN